MESKEQLRHLKRTIAASIERSKQNAEDLHAIEQALRENLERLRELRNANPGSPKRN